MQSVPLTTLLPDESTAELPCGVDTRCILLDWILIARKGVCKTVPLSARGLQTSVSVSLPVLDYVSHAQESDH